MAMKTISDIRKNYRDDMEKVSGSKIDSSAVNKALVVDFLDSLGVIKKANYKPQKRYLP